MWRYIAQLPALYGAVAELTKAVNGLINREGKVEDEMNEQAQLIEDLTGKINQHNADDLAYQGQVNTKFATLEARLAAVPNDAQGMAELTTAVQDLKTAVAAKPTLALPPDNPVTQTILTVPTSPVATAPLPVFPGVPAAPDPNAPQNQPPAPITAQTVPIPTAPTETPMPETTDTGTPVDATSLPAREPLPAEGTSQPATESVPIDAPARLAPTTDTTQENTA